ncbi:lysophospholipid acyltransferase LPCAT4 [Microcaecilia unicolor]|uniref:Lysophospholipid acyltransferase LPCAT4 n=1 Tax=Microcaecilia unicolor TaxID=1415580 RepID=A0A6P7WII9_9AMPH|nr:lysophospholipid acyltransferase LPCAT4 [Microcaecilia unicolor]
MPGSDIMKRRGERGERGPKEEEEEDEDGEEEEEEEDVGPPPNPFIHEVHLRGAWQHMKFYLLGVLLFPLRFLLTTFFLFLMWPFAVLRVVGLTEEELRQPIRHRRRFFHHAIRFLSRCMFFVTGFYRIKIKGRMASSLEAPILLAAPHSTFFDTLVVVPCDLPSVVSRVENLSIPVIGALLRFNQSILVSRHDPTSRKKVVEEVKRRATFRGEWPQLLFYPEGTTANGKVLLKFKPGAFIAGVPVQPILIRYPNKLPATTWTWKGNGVFKVLWLSMSQLYLSVEVEFLPVYHPNEAEKADPTLYASGVQRVMAGALGIPATDYELIGDMPVSPIGQLKVALELGLWELGKILKRARCLPMKAESCGGPCMEESDRRLSQEEFADRLNLTDSVTTSKAFSYFQKDARGCVDLHEVILVLAALDAVRSAKDVAELAFKLFAETQQGDENGPHLYEEGFTTILRCLLGTPCLESSKVFAEICEGMSAVGLSKDGFLDFSLHHPCYRQLFCYYLRPPARAKKRHRHSQRPELPTAATASSALWPNGTCTQTSNLENGRRPGHQKAS